MLIVETGAVIANANSYVTDAEYILYAGARGLEFGCNETERSIELIKSMDYLLGKEPNMKGLRTDDNSPLPYPRQSVYIRGSLLDKNTIPQELKNAQMEGAVLAGKFDLVINGAQSNVQRQKLDTLEAEFFSGGSWETIRLDSVDLHLKPLLNSYNGALVRV